MTDSTRHLRAAALLLLAAAIWGFAFAAQRLGAQHVGTFTFNAIRFAMGAGLLGIVIAVLDRRRGWHAPRRRAATRAALVPGTVTGALLAVAAGLQQAALAETTAGNAAFVTGLYMVLVPLAAVAHGKRVGLPTVTGIVAAVGGLYLISVTDTLRLHPGDGLVMLSAVGFAAQILLVDYYAGRLARLRFAATQFLSCAVFSALAALVWDAAPFAGLHLAIAPLVYTGILSVGVAYTLQVVAQRDAIATHAALIMSMESVFGALGGALFLGENMGPRGYGGAALMLTGIVVSQIGAAPRTPSGEPRASTHERTPRTAAS
ncbi:MAG: DMT family transporter [Bifidobacteriaceae bacterium]|nr:DMT family transporter [Bifidobacteriaceae bacterium]